MLEGRGANGGGFSGNTPKEFLDEMALGDLLPGVGLGLNVLGLAQEGLARIPVVGMGGGELAALTDENVGRQASVQELLGVGRQHGGYRRGEKVQMGQHMIADGHMHPWPPGQGLSGKQNQKKKSK